MYKTIIFDLDGTLLDTLDDLTDATNEVLRKRGLPLRTKEEVRSFVGNGIKKLIERALGTRTELLEEALEDFKSYYSQHCADKTKAYDGILEMLVTLKNKGVPTAVLSNKADFAVKKLAKEYFDGLLTAAVGEDEEKGIRKKPAPDGLLTLVKALGVEVKEALYVGDSEVDIQTAKNAGMDCLCVTWGFRDREFLQSQGGTLFVDKAEEILPYALEKL